MKKDLLTCILAMTWAWGLIWYLGRRKHPYERPDNIDREFQEMVERARKNGHTLSGPWHPTSQELVDQRQRCPVHGWACDNGAAEAKRREGARCAVTIAGGVNRTARRCFRPPGHGGEHDMLGEPGVDGQRLHQYRTADDQRARCPVHGWACDNGAAEAKRREGARDMLGDPYPHAHDEHGASSYSPHVIDQANRAHTTGQVRCPIHGSPCGRARRARETGLSQTDGDVGRRAASGQSAH